MAQEETERKEQEVGVLTGWEAGKIEGNYATMLHILQSKKGVRGGKVQGVQSTEGKSGLDPLVHSTLYAYTIIFLHGPIHLLQGW